jgi:cytochrome c-type biogenesis protein CcmH
MLTRISGLAMLAALLAIAPWAEAGYGSGDPRLEKLYGEFIAPCCWRQSIAIHDSPEAEGLRAQILSMIRDGRSDEEIKTALIAEYGKRILMVPEGTEGKWLFWTPWAAGAFGLAALALLLLRLQRPRRRYAADLAPAELEEGWDLD